MYFTCSVRRLFSNVNFYVFLCTSSHQPRRAHPRRAHPRRAIDAPRVVRPRQYPIFIEQFVVTVSPSSIAHCLFLFPPNRYSY